MNPNTNYNHLSPLTKSSLGLSLWKNVFCFFMIKLSLTVTIPSDTTPIIPCGSVLPKISKQHFNRWWIKFEHISQLLMAQNPLIDITYVNWSVHFRWTADQKFYPKKFLRHNRIQIEISVGVHRNSFQNFGVLRIPYAY